MYSEEVRPMVHIYCIWNCLLIDVEMIDTHNEKMNAMFLTFSARNNQGLRPMVGICCIFFSVVLLSFFVFIGVYLASKSSV